MTYKIEVQPRFRRSVRIDTDYANPTAIDDFHCPESYRQALAFMARHVSETGQAAFTWTGPYGGGKSSLALALACLTGADKKVRDLAIGAFGNKTVDALKEALPYFPARWDVLPLVCEKRSITKQLCETLGLKGRPSAKSVLKELENRTQQRGMLVILDELGRGLEATAEGEGDIHILQDLAELASRSDGKLIFIGILHQSFDEYADKLGRDARDSWAKIQGRFVDISISVSFEESIGLIAQAMGRKRADAGLIDLAESVSREVRSGRTKSAQKKLMQDLAKCAPLHPVVACLLGPLSRRRFGQNQRSVFSFLYSSEPFGLKDFDAGPAGSELYPVCQLWDYVRANFEGAVLASPDSRRWATGADAIDRCIARGGSELELALLKSISVLELLKDRSSLASTRACLAAAFHNQEKAKLNSALRSLERHSEIVFRKHAGAYVLYAGSDFDIEANLEAIVANQKRPSIELIQDLADIQPILAKRHHFETGAMRWFDFSIEAVAHLPKLKMTPARGDSIGKIVLAIPADGESEDDVVAKIGQTFETSNATPLIIGYTKESRNLVELGRELAGLQQLEDLHPELRGDAVARREIDTRAADLRGRIEIEVQTLLERADWYRIDETPVQRSKRAFNEWLSQIASATYCNSPNVQNELLNCDAPSSNAVSARTKLMKRMVLRSSDPALGFEGKNYPAERGLYVSLLESTGVHFEDGASALFQEPPESGPHNLMALWHTADALLAEAGSNSVTAETIIAKWGDAPIGLKAGLGPVYIVAYALSRKSRVAVYGEGLFQSSFDELCVEYLSRNTASVAFRHVEMEGLTGEILQNLGELLKLKNRSEPLHVAREIVSQFDALVPWTSRTQSLKPQTLRVREILKRATDPNKLLFDDLPSLSKPDKTGNFDPKEIARIVRDAMAEMRAAYPKTLSQLKALMLSELDVRAETSDALASLRERADNIRHIGGDLRLDAFIGRLAQYHGTEEDTEGIASVAANKLPRDWNDADRERARIEIADLSQLFLKLETLARVKNRKSKRQALAVVVGHQSQPLPLFGEFHVSDADRKDITALVTAVDEALAKSDQKRREIILAALVEISSRYLDDKDNPLLERLA